MKGYIKKLLRENLIVEKLVNVDNDVDDLYRMFFKDDIDEISRTGFITNDMFQKQNTNTDILTDDESIQSNELNPCGIYVNYGLNGYIPEKNIISISFASGAKNYVMDFGGDLNKAIDALSDETQKINLRTEFSEEKLKGSIHHELAHWIDDTMNNRHVRSRLEKQVKFNTRDLGGIPVDATKMEIQGQIHNVKQLKNKYSDKWDEITFADMMKLSPTLSIIHRDLPYKFKSKWIRDLKTRMHREGLLGKNMIN